MANPLTDADSTIMDAANYQQKGKQVEAASLRKQGAQEGFHGGLSAGYQKGAFDASQSLASELNRISQERVLMDIQSRLQDGAPVSQAEMGLYSQATQGMPSLSAGPRGEAPSFAGKY